jgi:Skp family chaperone for outer membrane proteins
MSKRSNQISADLKEELNQKLQEFASTTDNLEEIFENREQIEISKFYEKMPKPVAMAMDQFLEDGIIIRRAED